MEYNGTVVSPKLVAFPYFLSSDLDLEVCVKVRSFEYIYAPAAGAHTVEYEAGLLNGSENGDRVNLLPKELYVSAHLFCQGEALHVVGILSHSCRVSGEDPNKVKWDEWLTFPVKYRDLEHDASVVFTIWSVGSVPVGRTVMYLFDRDKGCLRRGKVKLKVTPLVSSRPAGYVGQTDDILNPASVAGQPRIWELTESFNRKQIQSLDWLDSLLVRRVNQLRDQSSDVFTSSEEQFEDGSKSISHTHLLNIETPFFEHPVLYEEKSYAQSTLQSANATNNLFSIPSKSVQTGKDRRIRPSSSRRFKGEITTTTNVNTENSDKLPFEWESSLVTYRDPEIMRLHTDGSEEKNPVEIKYFKITRSVRRGLVDPDLKPDKTDRARIQSLIHSPDAINQEDLDLLWKYRHSLKSDKKALTKFVCSVDWNDEQEVKQAADLLDQWKDIDVADALKLLSSEPQFRSTVVRAHAIRILDKAGDDELLMYLLQLVQALRYDVAPTTSRSPEESNLNLSITANQNSLYVDESQAGNTNNHRLGLLARFLIRRAVQNEELSSLFNWYLAVEISGNQSGSGILFSKVHEAFFVSLKNSGEKGKEVFLSLQIQSATFKQIMAAGNIINSSREKATARTKSLRKLLSPNGRFHDLMALRQPVPIPLYPKLRFTGVDHETAKVLVSTTYPMVLDLILENNTQGQGSNDNQGISTSEVIPTGTNKKETATANHRIGPTTGSASFSDTKVKQHFKIMFKTGDDLRQDQLVLQMIGVMDSMFKNVNLDLNLTIYRVLATSTTEGMMEFVSDAFAVSKVLAQYGTTRNFFRKHCPWPPRRGQLSDVRTLSSPEIKSQARPSGSNTEQSEEAGPVHSGARNTHMMIGSTSKSGAGAVVAEAQRDGIDPNCLSRFIKSCAGYCVISYVIGIGDRHLDNIMIKPTGELFHIDFGFIFGRDPKAWATPIRLTKEMIETMGGRESAGYQRFKSHCCQAFKVLRNNASLILNLFHLMKDAGIPDLSINQDYHTVLLKMKNRFMLDRSDEQAETQLLNLIDQSADALAPVIYDMFHRAATAIK